MLSIWVPHRAAGGKRSRDSSRCIVQGTVDVVQDKERDHAIDGELLAGQHGGSKLHDGPISAALSANPSRFRQASSLA